MHLWNIIVRKYSPTEIIYYCVCLCVYMFQIASLESLINQIFFTSLSLLKCSCCIYTQKPEQFYNTQLVKFFNKLSIFWLLESMTYLSIWCSDLQTPKYMLRTKHASSMCYDTCIKIHVSLIGATCNISAESSKAIACCLYRGSGPQLQHQPWQEVGTNLSSCRILITWSLTRMWHSLFKYHYHQKSRLHVLWNCFIRVSMIIIFYGTLLSTAKSESWIKQP